LITLDRPKVKNAFNQELYQSLSNCLNWAAKNDQINVAVLTGTGDFYSSVKFEIFQFFQFFFCFYFFIFLFFLFIYFFKNREMI